MACGLRDRDAIISRGGIIFRVLGYSHPPSGYLCDVEYAASEIYHSSDPRALRKGFGRVFYKFFEDEGLKFVRNKYPQYKVYHLPLRRWLVGVKKRDVASTRFPVQALQSLLNSGVKDEVSNVLRDVLSELTSISSLKTRVFGVFGSLLHSFYHPKYSDIDLIVVGKRGLRKIRESLHSIYNKEGGLLVNEFASSKYWNKRHWRFTNISLEEHVWHQRRKLIYGVYVGSASKRMIKIEFEPVKDFSEISSEYSRATRISRLGWIEAYGRILDDEEGAFMPSIYGFELDEATGQEVDEISRIVSYIEEFRMQVRRGERVFAAGNLERVTSLRGRFNQITLTRGPRYYEQALKTVKV